MRTALLPAGGDPFLIAYWLRHFRTWADEVDELRLAVCGQPDPAIRSYLRDCANEFGGKVILSFHPRTDHGAMIGWLLSETPAGTVMLCEDDAFVRKPGAVANRFRMIEDGATDLVGCPRASGTPQLLEAANRALGVLSAPATGEQGPLFWPCFLFARRSDLLATDGNFGASWWDGAEKLLGISRSSDHAVDTFGWASLQLRAMGLRVTVEAQYRAQRDLMPDWGAAPWFHVGSLSAGYGLYLLGDMDPADRQNHWNAIRNDIYDWDKRMSWWQRVRDRWDGSLPEHHAAYSAAIDDYLRGTGMEQGNVDKWRAAFDHMVTWPE